MNLRIAKHMVVIAATVLTLGSLGAYRQSLNAQGSVRQAPIFEVDPFWPKPLPNHWVTGSTIGLSVDAQDSVWTIHRPNTVEDNFKAADIKVGDAQGRDDEALPGGAGDAGRRPDTFIGKCCKVAPPVLVYDQAGNLVKSWGGPGQGLRLARQQSRHHRRPQGQRVARGQRRQGHADPQVQRRRKVSLPDRQARRPQRQQRHRELLAADEDLRRRLGQRGLHRRRVRQPPRNRVRRRHAASTSGTGAPTAASRATNRCRRTTRMARPRSSSTRCTAPSCRTTGCVYVCDRVNDRIQVFRKDGTFVKEVVHRSPHVPLGIGVGHDVLARSRSRPISMPPTASTRKSTSCCAARSRC